MNRPPKTGPKGCTRNYKTLAFEFERYFNYLEDKLARLQKAFNASQIGNLELISKLDVVEAKLAKAMGTLDTIRVKSSPGRSCNTGIEKLYEIVNKALAELRSDDG